MPERAENAETKLDPSVARFLQQLSARGGSAYTERNYRQALVHVQAEDMAGFVSTRVQKPAKGIRELVVHQELHALVSTT